jgi:hypothetical protein
VCCAIAVTEAMLRVVKPGLEWPAYPPASGTSVPAKGVRGLPAAGIPDAEQLERDRPWIETDRRLRQLVGELEALAIQTRPTGGRLAAQTSDQQPEPAPQLNPTAVWTRTA